MFLLKIWMYDKYGLLDTVYHEEHHHLLDITMKVTYLS